MGEGRNARLQCERSDWMNMAKKRRVSVCLRRPCLTVFFSSPLLEKGRTLQRSFPDRGSNDTQRIAHPFSGLREGGALSLSNPFSGSTDRCSCPSELVLFSPSPAPQLHQCTLALTLSQPREGDLFPLRKETGSDSKGHRDWLQQGRSEDTVQTRVNTGVTIVLMGRL